MPASLQLAARLAVSVVILASLWFIQGSRFEVLLAIPIVLIADLTWCAIVAGVSLSIVGSVLFMHLPALGWAAMPGAIHNSYFWLFRSGDIVHAVVVVGAAVAAIRGSFIAKPEADAGVAPWLPRFAEPLRLGAAAAPPMILVVALPFGLLSTASSWVWAAVWVLVYWSLQSRYGRVVPEPRHVEPMRPPNDNPYFQARLLAILTAVVLLPFLSKPFHIDDPLFMWTAKQITEDPVDFYGFDLAMNGMRVPMFREMQNPPLYSYILAPIGALTGWREQPMHLVALAFTIAAVLGTFALARRYCTNAWAAAALLLATPGFFVSANTVMCDVPMIAFYVWAAYCWVAGYDGARHRWLLAAGTLIAASALTKYFGMTLVPLLFAYSVVRSRGLRKRQLYLLLPVVVLAAYEIWTRDFYGRGLLLGASDYVRKWPSSDEGYAPTWLVGLMFAGGTFGVLVLAAFAFARTRMLIALTVGLAALTAGAAALLRFLEPNVGVIQNLSTLNFYLSALFIALALMLIGFVAVTCLRKPDADAVLLGLWFAGGLLFAIAANWSVTTRAMLPAAVPAAIVLVRWVESYRGPYSLRKGAWRVAVVFGVLLGVSVQVAIADLSFARNERAMAIALAEVYDGEGTFWFDGRWGLEYYLREYGGTTFLSTEVEPGDTIAFPDRADVEALTEGHVLTRTHFVQIPRFGRVHTMFAGAGFHSALFGPMPYAIGRAPIERYSVYKVVR